LHITGVDGDWDLEVGNSETSVSFDEYEHNLQTCNCNEYIYLNDVGTNETHKFKIDSVNGITEIGTHHMDWPPMSMVIPM